jgi:hypothetical protein
MLKNIEQLVVRDIRTWDGEHTFNFHEGITVLHGQNGRGKTTLNTALMLTLVFSANSNGLQQDLTPRNGGSPRSSVIFSTEDGRRFRVSKTWGDRNQSRLFDADTNEELARGGDAEDQTRELAFGIPPSSGRYTARNGLVANLEQTIENYVATLTFYSQGSLHIAPKMGEALRNIGLVADEAERARGFTTISLVAQSEAQGLISGVTNTGLPRANASGRVINQQRVLEEIRDEIQQARDIEANLIEAESNLFEITDGVDEDINEETRQEKLQMIRGFTREATTHRAEREEARILNDQSKETHVPLKAMDYERKTLTGTAKNKTKGLNDHDKSEALARTKFETADGSHALKLRDKDTHSAELENIKLWQLYLTQEQRNQEQTVALDKALEHRENHEEGLVRQATLQQQRENLLLASDEQWSEIREYDAQIAAAKAGRTMQVKFGTLPKNWVVEGDGHIIEKEGVASENIEVRNKEEIIFEVRQAMDGASPSELELMKKEVLGGLNAATMSELNQRQVEATRLETEIDVSKRALAMLPPTPELDASIAELRAKIDHRVAEPDRTLPEGNLHDEGVRVAERLRLAEEALETARDARAQAQAEHLASQSLLVVARTTCTESLMRLEEHRTTYGTDEDVVQQLTEASERLETVAAVLKAFVDNKELREDSPERRAERLQQSLDTYDQQRDGLIRLEERVIRLRENPLLQRLPDLEAALHIESDALSRLQLEYQAYDLIRKLAEEAGVAAQQLARNETSERMHRLLNYVWGVEADLTFAEDGAPTQTRQIDIKDESHGTKEQLQTILRLVLLSTAAENGTTMLLDDALVFSDDGRLDRMKAVLHVESNAGMQLIIFTCRPDDYVDIADEIINLDLL